MNVADREWLRDVAWAMTAWGFAFAAGSLVVEWVEQRDLGAALAGLPGRGMLVAPLVAALGAGATRRAWSADGRRVAVAAIGRSPARFSVVSALAGGALAVAVLAAWEVAPTPGPARGAWVVLPGPILPALAPAPGARLWLRAARVSPTSATGIDAAWLVDGALAAAGRASSATWDGRQWTVEGAGPTVSVDGRLSEVGWELPEPAVWRASARPGPQSSVSRLWASPRDLGRTAWLSARILAIPLAAASGALAAAVAGTGRAWALACLLAAFASIGQTTVTLAVTQGRVPPWAVAALPALAASAAVLAGLRQDRHPESFAPRVGAG